MLNLFTNSSEYHINEADKHTAKAGELMKKQEQTQVEAAWHVLQAERHLEQAKSAQSKDLLLMDIKRKEA